MSGAVPIDRVARTSDPWLPELLGEPDENSFGASDVAEPIHRRRCRRTEARNKRAG